jgi:hypothetical protein
MVPANIKNVSELNHQVYQACNELKQSTQDSEAEMGGAEMTQESSDHQIHWLPLHMEINP